MDVVAPAESTGNEGSVLLAVFIESASILVTEVGFCGGEHDQASKASKSIGKYLMPLKPAKGESVRLISNYL